MKNRFLFIVIIITAGNVCSSELYNLYPDISIKYSFLSGAKYSLHKEKYQPINFYFTHNGFKYKLKDLFLENGWERTFYRQSFKKMYISDFGCAIPAIIAACVLVWANASEGNDVPVSVNISVPIGVVGLFVGKVLLDRSSVKDMRKAVALRKKRIMEK